MLHLGDVELGVFLLEKVGIDESGFMPQVLRALAEMFRKERLGFPFQDVGLVGGYAVPKLGAPLMEVVDGRKIEILPMPAKKGLPRSDVAVGGGDALHVDVDRVVENGVQLVEVPGACSLVHERVEQVSPIERRREDNIFPKLQ